MQFLNKPVVLFDIDYTLFDTAHFKETKLKEFRLYDEVEKVLTDLSKGFVLGIFSEGETDLQIEKLKKTKIYRFFQPDHIYIEILKKDKIQSISRKYRETFIYMVDDKLPILKLMKQALPNATTIWIKRGEYAMKQQSIPGFTPESSVENLLDILRIVKSEVWVK